jgi:hypothetical protein
MVLLYRLARVMRAAQAAFAAAWSAEPAPEPAVEIVPSETFS